MTTTQTTSQTTTPAPGTVVKTTDAGACQVRIVKAVGGWTVTVWCGATPVEGWTGSYPTRRETKAAFDHAVRVFTAHRTLEGIDRRRHQLIAERDRLARLPSQKARCAVIDDQLDMLLDLDTIALEPRFIADLTRRLAA